MTTGYEKEWGRFGHQYRKISMMSKCGGKANHWLLWGDPNYVL